MSPIYEYGCNQDKDHPRQEVVHSVKEVIRLYCATCGGEMHRIPQLFAWYKEPMGVLWDGYDKRWREMRAKNIKRRNRNAPNNKGRVRTSS